MPMGAFLGYTKHVDSEDVIGHVLTRFTENTIFQQGSDAYSTSMSVLQVVCVAPRSYLLWFFR